MKALNWIAPSVLVSALLVLAAAANSASGPASLPVSRSITNQTIAASPSHFTATQGTLPVSRNRPVVNYTSSLSFTQTNGCAAPVSRSNRGCNF